MKFILRHKPDVVVHCAAYTAVDRAEEEREKCYAVNVEGTKNIAKACKKIDAKMLYVSTDYVFSGEGVMPHKEDDPTNPINYYGYTKKLGEDIVKNMLEKFFIIRTSWLYGKKGKNFVKTMLETAQTQSEVNVVSDQIGSPTYAKDLAVLICDIIQTDKFGIYHGTNEGYCSWYEFAKAIFDKKGIHVKLNSITSDQYPTKAKRPLNSRLSKEKLDEAGFKRLPHWEDGLERYLKEQPFLEQ